eukprot:jgi/Chlat1/6605/Chrsp46S06099
MVQTQAVGFNGDSHRPGDHPLSIVVSIAPDPVRPSSGSVQNAATEHECVSHESMQAESLSRSVHGKYAADPDRKRSQAEIALKRYGSPPTCWARNTVLYTRLAMSTILAVALTVVTLVVILFHNRASSRAVDTIARRFSAQLLDTSQQQLIRLLSDANVTMTVSLNELYDSSLLPTITDSTINTTIRSIAWSCISAIPTSITVGYVSVNLDSGTAGSSLWYYQNASDASSQTIVVQRSNTTRVGVWLYAAADEHGKPVGPVTEVPVLANLRDQPSWKVLSLPRKSFMWAFSPGTSRDATPFLALTAPVYSNETATMGDGLWGVSISLQAIQNFLYSVDSGHGSLFVMNDEGYLLAASQGTYFAKRINKTTPALLLANESSSDVIREAAVYVRGTLLAANSNATTFQGSFLSSNGTMLYTDAALLTFESVNLVSVLVMPRTELFAGIDSTNRATTLGLSLMAVGVLLVGALLIVLCTRGVSHEVKLKEGLVLACRQLDTLNGRYRIAKQEAEAANAAKSMFLAQISHELRTPMTGIMGFVEVLLGFRNLSEEQRDCLMQVESCSAVLLQLVNDLLDINSLELEEAQFDLVNALEGVVDIFGRQAEERGVAMVLKLEHDVPTSVIGDEGRVRQIFTNLVSNSAKFTKAGHIIVQGEVVTMEEAKLDSCGDATMHFIVDDTGIGIPKERREAVWEPFVQADTATTRRFGGTGLGLPIVRSLINLMGGQIRVAGKVSPGTCMDFNFRVKLPALSQMASPEIRMPTTMSVSELRVLLLMPEGLLRSLAQDWLQSQKATVLCAQNLQQVRDIASQLGRNTLVLLDDAWLPALQPAEVQAFVVDLASALPDSCTVAIAVSYNCSAQGSLQQHQKFVVTKPLHPVRMKKVVHAALERIEAAQRTSMPALSLGSSQAAVQKRPVDDARSLKGANVLVAEDNLVNQKLIGALLKRQGANVTVVGDGGQAVRAASQNAYDFILMDCQMPVLSGYEATQALRKMEEGTSRRVPIIALTANAYAEDEKKGYECGMDAYLVKPINVATLYATASKYCRNVGQSATAS